MFRVIFGLVVWENYGSISKTVLEDIEMKKKKLLKKMKKLEESLSAMQSMQEPCSTNESFTEFVRNQDFIVRKLSMMEDRLNQLTNEHQQIMLTFPIVLDGSWNV